MSSFCVHVHPSPPRVPEVSLTVITFAGIHFRLLAKVPLETLYEFSGGCLELRTVCGHGA